MKIEKIITILIICQLSVACVATPYEPSKLTTAPKGVAPPKSSVIDDVQVASCKHQFNQKQSLEEVAIFAALMKQDCDLSQQQILQLAQQEFATQ